MNSRQPTTVVLAHAAIDRLDCAIASLERFRWIYFGKDFDRFSQFRETLSDRAENINAGQMINTIAKEIAPEFPNFDRHLDTGDELLWQTTDMADGNPYVCELFYQCCAMLGMSELLDNRDSDLLVVVEDPLFAWRVYEYAKRRHVPARFLCGGLLARLSLDKVVCIAHIVRMFVLAISGRCGFVLDHARARWRRCHHRKPEDTETECDVLLVTWVGPDTFSADRLIDEDTYFGSLPKLLRDNNSSVAYVANPLDWVHSNDSIAENVDRAIDTIVSPIDCVSIPDAIRIAWITLTYRIRLNSRFLVGDVDLSSLIKDETRRERAKVRQSLSMKYSFVGRYLHVRGLNPVVVIHPYEAQSWEKALRLGLMKYLPGIRIVGYQHAPFAPLWMGYRQSIRDQDLQRFPDRILAIGSRWKKTLTEIGVPDELVYLTGALRFRHINETARRNLIEASQPVLVAAPIGLHDAAELLYKSLLALGDFADVKVLFKLHPKMGGNGVQLAESVLKLLGRQQLPDNFQMTDRPVSELLNEVRAIVHNGTSVAVEAVARGIPVIFVCSDLWFDMDTLGFVLNTSRVARTSDEIRLAVSEAEIDSTFVVGKWFLPVENSIVNDFLAN